MVTFDGINKLMICDYGLVTLDIKSLYSAWKEWAATSDNLKYELAFLVIGGEPTIGNNIITPYFFLLNDWKIRPHEANHTLDVTGIVLVSGGGDAFVDTIGTWRIGIKSIVPIYTETVLVDTGEGSFLTKQDVRDALALDLAGGTTIENDSIENKINRVDINTQS